MMILSILLSLLGLGAPSVEKVYNSSADAVVKVERYETAFAKDGTRLPLSAHSGHGTGVIVSKKGYILTARHVASKSSLFLITTRGGYVYEAGILCICNFTDLAILQPVHRTNVDFPMVGLGSSVHLGQSVVHIGCPLSFDWFVSQGIVSLLHEYLVLSNTVMNPGSSGGPLFTMCGELVGIASAIVTVDGLWSGHSIFVGPDAINEFLAGWRQIL